ncbi:hypothetical protein HanLR1_Chr09g0298891 [Helianthus annuus]|nr:hypothetical protein HanHA89_Chr09g0318581 [Helianthus annuus]KAJ0705752.1 hypothetical protein HanLR1_Chr09g0298891 [Helianthus annuus]
MYIKTIHFGATWHILIPLIATWHSKTIPSNSLSANLLHAVSPSFFLNSSLHLSNLELITAIFPLLFNHVLLFLSQLSIKFIVSVMNTSFPLYLILQIKNPKSKSIFPFSD